MDKPPWPISRLDLEAGPDQAGRVGRQSGREREPGAFRLERSDANEESNRIVELVTPGRPRSAHLDDKPAEGPDVRWARVALVAHHLRRHPGNGPSHGLRLHRDLSDGAVEPLKPLRAA